MKKQALFVLVLSSLLLSACNNPVTSSASNRSEPSSSEEQSSSQSSEPSKESTPTSQSQQPSQSSQSSSGSETGIEDLGVKETHTALMKQYLEDPDWTSIKTYVPKVNAEDRNYHNDQSQPNPVELKFNEVAAASKYYVQIAKNAQFTNAKLVESTTKTYNFYNSELGQEYYYRAAVSQEALAQAKVYKFKVNDAAPRFIHVDGVINFRDQGGWKSSLVPNGVIKQGLYYRCAQFNNGNTKNITADGLKAIQELGIKVDIDMRDSSAVPAVSPLKTNDYDVNLVKASVPSGSESDRWEGSTGTWNRVTCNIAAQYKIIFETIAQADEKPIALHCTHGADRTGIVSFFLMGLLGASEDDIGRDYVMTRFAGERAVLPTGSGSEIAKWFTKTNALAGATFADKTYKHLKDDFGISADTLETIREKFVPGYTRPAGN